MKKMKIAVIGVGLIGGSIVLSLKDKREITSIKIYDRYDNTSIDNTLKITPETSIENAVNGVDIVFVCTPAKSVVETVKTISAVNKDCIITDVASVKEQIEKQIESITNNFVGGHPMAGSEISGINGASESLFQNTTWVLTPTESTHSEQLSTLKQVIELTGSFVLSASPQQHDQAVAVVSHLPQLLSSALLLSALKQHSSNALTLKLAAGGFRDMTRIAGSNPIMWRDIFDINSQMILEALATLKDEVNNLESLIKNKDLTTLLDKLEYTKEGRSQIPPRGRPTDVKYYDLSCKISDKPGAIADIVNLAAQNNIDIVDLKILHNETTRSGKLIISLRETDYIKFKLILVQNNILPLSQAIIVAIDGTAGAGKTLTAKLLHEKLNLPRLDTGLLYRLIGYAASKQLDNISDIETKVDELMKTTNFELIDDDIIFDGQSFKDELSKKENAQNASKIAIYQQVRDYCNKYFQNWISKNGGGIVVGRDIGTVVFPKAFLKIFLDADPAVKAERRAKQINESDQTNEIRERDKRDTQRAIAKTLPADDAIVIDTGKNSPADVLKIVEEHFWEKI